MHTAVELALTLNKVSSGREALLKKLRASAPISLQIVKIASLKCSLLYNSMTCIQ